MIKTDLKSKENEIQVWIAYQLRKRYKNIKKFQTVNNVHAKFRAPTKRNKTNNNQNNGCPESMRYY